MPLKKLVKFCNQFNFSLDFVVGFSRENHKYSKKIILDKVDVGMKLKNLRTKLELSQQQMADECSIARSTYSHYEIGMSLITTMALYAICKNHKLSMDKFLRN